MWLIIDKNLFDYGFLEASGDSRVFSINVFSNLGIRIPFTEPGFV